MTAGQAPFAARFPGQGLVVRTSQPVRRVLSPRAVAPARVATIHLGALLPTRSSGLPESSGGPPSNALCLTLLRVGFTEPSSHLDAGALLPHRFTLACARLPGPSAVYFLLHFPASHLD